MSLEPLTMESLDDEAIVFTADLDGAQQDLMNRPRLLDHREDIRARDNRNPPEANDDTDLWTGSRYQVRMISILNNGTLIPDDTNALSQGERLTPHMQRTLCMAWEERGYDLCEEICESHVKTGMIVHSREPTFGCTGHELLRFRMKHESGMEFCKGAVHLGN